MSWKVSTRKICRALGWREVLEITIDKKLDVIVRHREKNKISKSTVRYDDYNERYFYAARQRIYLSDLRKVVCT